MSPAKVLTIATLTGVATATRVLCVTFELATRTNLIPDGIDGLADLAVGIFWLILVGAWIVGQVDQRTTEVIDRAEAKLDANAAETISHLEQRLGEAVAEAGDRSAIATTVAALSDAKKWPAEPRRPHLVEN